VLGGVWGWSAGDDRDAAWLEQRLGRPVPVVGDLKAEAPFKQASLRLSRVRIIAGSTRPGDEAALLRALPCLPGRPLLVLAPRHRERFDEVAQLLARSGLTWQRRSQLERPRLPEGTRVLLLDTVGELAGLYEGASAAFVGGSFDASIGGHSAAEAARAAVPVVHGPQVSSNASSFARARCFPAVEPGELAGALAAAMQAERPAPALGAAAERALDLIAPLAAAPVPPGSWHRPLAWPLVPAYRAAAALRRRRARATGPLPVISVGNLASGGTGKTQVVGLLARRLRALGLKPAVLSRGYGRAPGGPTLRDSVAGPADGAFLGDEPAMLATQGLLVVSCPDRLQGAGRARELGADLVLLDDGLQQRQLAVDLDLVVLDAREPLAGGPIPVGELREPPEALRRADLLWVNHGPLPASLQRFSPPDGALVLARTVARGWRDHGGGWLPLHQGPKGEVLVLAGIARPGGFLRGLRGLGLLPAVRELYPDHQRWTAAQLQRVRHRAGGLPIVTTEKDLARLPASLGALALVVELELLSGAAALDQRLRGFCRQHDLAVGEGS